MPNSVADHLHKNTVNTKQDNMSPLKPNSTTTVGPEKCSMAEKQDKDFKIAFMNMLKLLREEMNKLIKEIYENTNSEMK